MFPDGKLDEVVADDRPLDLRAELEPGDRRLLGVDADLLKDDATLEVVVPIENLKSNKIDKL